MHSPFGWKLKPLVFALLGILCILAYFFLFAQSQIGQILPLQKSKEEILAQAERALQQSPLGQYELQREVRVELNDDLSRYAQLSVDKGSLLAQLPLGRWIVTCENKVSVTPESGGVRFDTGAPEKKDEEVRFIAEYDFSGKLVGMQQQYPGIKASPRLIESEALARAHAYLHAAQTDTSRLRLTQKKTTEEGQISKFEFTFKRPYVLSSDLQEKITVEVSRSEITLFRSGVEVDPAKFKRPKSDEVSEIVFMVGAFVVWITISVFLVILLFKRVRHDELEFTRALWLGLISGLIMWSKVAIQNFGGGWDETIIGGIFAALFTGGSLILVYAVAESLAREVWPEKLVLSDLAFRGLFRAREIGAAILHSFFIGGMGLLLYGLALWLGSRLPFSYFDIDNDQLWPLRNNLTAGTEFFGTLLSVLFGTFLLFTFWNSYLRRRFQSQVAVMGLLAMSLSLTGFASHYLRPEWLSFLLILPPAAYWARHAFEQDTFTMLVSLLIFLLIFELSVIAILPEGWSGLPAVVAMAICLVLLVAGGLLSRSTKIAKDYEDYVPSYVSRIAQRERFLKELEIARIVQMRFLPNRVPLLPRLELASICRPAMEVGGDYFDFISHDGQALSVLIGDVSGKGVSAAFYMTMAKGIIKTLVKKASSPKQVLAEMNAVFYENSPKEVFISLIYGYFDLRQNTLTFARAGHNPLIVHKSISGAPQLLNPKGLAIGMDSGAVFEKTIEEVSVPTAPGDLFVFYTDGISECMNKNGEEFGEERLSDFIGQNAHEPAQVLMDKITHEITQYSAGVHQHDDFTMVVVKVRGDD
ncbi:MAG: SpoIIE family protein phosphatase [bacterium]